MAQFKLWGIYNSFGNLEQWTREHGAKMEALVDNEEHDLSIEYFSQDDPRCSQYGFTRFPMFVAVKHNQPFQKLTGKNEWHHYEAWIRGLGWKLDQ